jgi:hypothetical protein
MMMMMLITTRAMKMLTRPKVQTTLLLGLGWWCLSSSVTVTATLTVLVLLLRGSEMSVTPQTRSWEDRLGRGK